MIKKNKHQIWYENSMKLNNKGWNCQKNNQEDKRTQRIAMIRMMIKFNKQKKKELKSND